MITFGKKLKYLRNKNHLTQKQLGISVGFSENCADIRIAQYEGGDRTPKEDIVKKLAKALCVPTEILTTPVLSEPKEYYAASFWRHELSMDLYDN